MSAGAGFTNIPLNRSDNGQPDDPTFDIFCASHVQLADGRVLVTGGTEHGEVGMRDAAIFDPDATPSRWLSITAMDQRRWYPTNTRLANGDIFVASGVKYPVFHIFGGRDALSPTANPSNGWRRLGENLDGTWEATKTTVTPLWASVGGFWSEGRAHHTITRAAKWTGDATSYATLYRPDVGKTYIFGGEYFDSGTSQLAISNKTYLMEEYTPATSADEEYFFGEENLQTTSLPTDLARAEHITESDDTDISGHVGLFVFGGRTTTAVNGHPNLPSCGQRIFPTRGDQLTASVAACTSPDLSLSLRR